MARGTSKAGIFIGIGLISLFLLSAGLVFAAEGEGPEAAQAATSNIQVPEKPYEEYAAFFDYDPDLPLETIIRGVEEHEFYDVVNLVFKSANDEWVPALLFLPKNLEEHYEKVKAEDTKRYERLQEKTFGTKGPWPVVLYMHFLMDDKTRATMIAPQWAEWGIALLSLDGVNRGERERVYLTDCKGKTISTETKYSWDLKKIDAKVAESNGTLCREGGPKNILETDIAQTQKNMRQQIIDVMRGVDFLQTRSEINPDRIGFLGISMGSITGAVACALDPRIKVIALADGAASIKTMFENTDTSIPEMQETMKEIEGKGYTLEKVFELLDPIDPIHFVDKISPRPTIMINGRHDEIIPFPAIQMLHEMVKDPKKIIIYNSGHLLPINGAMFEIYKWYKEYL